LDLPTVVVHQGANLAALKEQQALNGPDAVAEMLLRHVCSP
jgi:hypothetical protein